MYGKSEGKPGKLRATLLELWKRITPIKVIKGDLFYFNGEDNLYPYKIEGVINSSPTAFRCADLMAKYIEGQGLKEGISDLIVNKQKNYKLSNIIEMAASDIAYHYGVWIHVSYGFDFKTGEIIPKELDILDYVECRKMKDDDSGYSGKVIVKDWIGESKSPKGKQEKADDYEWYYPFNKNQKVVLAQIKADSNDEPDISEAIKSYRGQVYYLNLTPKYKYALPRLDSVYNDGDSENRFSLYINTQFRNGFLGKTIALTSGLEDAESDKVAEDLKTFLGSENSGDFYYLSLENVSDLDKVIKFQQLLPQFNDKLFEATGKQVRKNIMGAFNNVPEALVLSGDGAMFGTSDETYKQMKLFYSEQTEKERYRLSETLTFLGFPCEIKPKIEAETVNKENGTT